jgi:hypothetical protein
VYTVFRFAFALILATLGTVSVAYASRPAATVTPDVPQRTYSAEESVWLSGTDFLPDEPLLMVVITAIAEDHTIIPQTLTISPTNLSVDSAGKLSGYVSLPSIPSGTQWVEILVIAEQSSVRGASWLRVETGAAGARLSKTVGSGLVVIGDGGTEIADLNEALNVTGSGWSGQSINSVVQREYSDLSGTTLIQSTAVSIHSVSISSDDLTGTATTTGSYNGSTLSLKISVMDGDFIFKFSNAMPTPDETAPTLVSSYAYSLTKIAVTFSEPVTIPADGSSENNWTISNPTVTVEDVYPAGGTATTCTLSVGTMANYGVTPGIAFATATDEYEDAQGNDAATDTDTALDSIPPGTVTITAPTVNTLIGSTSFAITATADYTNDTSLDGVIFEGSDDGSTWIEINLNHANSSIDGVTSDNTFSVTWIPTSTDRRFSLLRARAFDNRGAGGTDDAVGSDDNVTVSATIGQLSHREDLKAAFRLDVEAATSNVTVDDGSGGASYSASITVRQLNRYEIAADAYNAAPTVWNLSSNSTGTAKFWEEDAASTEIFTTDISGSSSTTFYYTDTKSGSPTVTIQKTSNPPFSGLVDSKNSVTQGQTINADSQNKLLVIVPGESADPGTDDGKSGSPDSQTANQNLSGTVDVYVTDRFFNAVNPSSDVYVDLSSSSPGNTTITDQNGGTAGDATIATSGSSVSFAVDEVQFTASGTYTLTATHDGGGLTSNAGTAISVAAGAASKLLTKFPGQTFVNGTGVTGSATAQTAGSSFNIVLYAVDTNDNLATSEDAARNVDFASTAGNAPAGNQPTISGQTSGSWSNISVSFTDGTSANVAVVFYDTDTDSITASIDDGSPTMTGVASTGVVVNGASLDNFVVVLTASAEMNIAFTGTNTVTARDAYNNVITGFDASSTNITMSVSVGGGLVEVASRGDGVLDQADDFTSGVANLTSIGFKYYSGTAGSRTIQASDGSGHTGTDAVTVTVNAPTVSTPSPTANTQLSTGAASQAFSATFAETNATGSYKLYWRSGNALSDSSGSAADSLTASTGGGSVTATLNSTKLSAMSGSNYMFWWFGGTDAADNDLIDQPTTGARSVAILDPTVAFTGATVGVALAAGQTSPWAYFDATGEMTGSSVTVTRMQFTKSGTAANTDIDEVKLYLDADQSNTVTGGDVLLQTVTTNDDTKLNSPNFNSFSETVTVTNTTAQRFLFVIVVASGANIENTLGYRINAVSDIDLGTSVADKSGTFPLPSGVVDASLPVELSEFKIASSPAGNVLGWVTESEVENAVFYILRTTESDGLFERVSRFIPGFGTTPSRHDYTWLDSRVVPGEQYWYALEQHDYDGTVTREDPIVAAVVGLPDSWDLHPATPNPFNPETVLRYEVPETGMVHMTVYDILGRPVRTLVDGSVSAGIHHINWDGRDERGSAVASGTYLIRLAAGDGSAVRMQRVTLLR